MGEKLKKKLTEPGTLLVPGVYDALTAKLVERSGFPAVYMTGAGVSYSLLGSPDIGLLSLTEMADQASRIADAVQIPLIADGDNGFGNAINVRRTVKVYEKAGVSAIQIEDQAFPKKCGHMNNKVLISKEEMAGKIKSAVDARNDEDFLIIARTDARGVVDLQEAIERAHLYAEAGADIIFVEAPQSVDELKEVASKIRAPLMANMVEGGKTPVLPVSQLEQLGYKIVIYPNTITRFYVKQVMRILQMLKNDGSSHGYAHEMFMFNEINQILGLQEIIELEKKYAAN